MRLLLRLLPLIAAGLLAACASTPAPDAGPLPERPARDAIRQFDLTGRAVIRHAQGAETVRLMWQHSPAEDAIGFATPLGNVVSELQRDALGARWLTAAGERYEARSADQLMARLTDVPVPLDALALWVTGRVRDSARELRRDPLGRLTSAQDGEWSVAVTAYESDTPNALPRTLEASREGVAIRLAIEEWRL